MKLIYLILIYVSVIIIGVSIGVLVERPIAFKDGMEYQQWFDTGLHDSWYYETHPENYIDLPQGSCVTANGTECPPTRIFYQYPFPSDVYILEHPDYPYIKGWVHYNLTHELRPISAR